MPLTFAIGFAFAFTFTTRLILKLEAIAQDVGVPEKVAQLVA